MLKERIKELFKSYDSDIRQVIFDVGDLEQMHISMPRPHILDQVDQIITRIANEQLKQNGSDSDDMLEE